MTDRGPRTLASLGDFQITCVKKGQLWELQLDARMPQGLVRASEYLEDMGNLYMAIESMTNRLLGVQHSDLSVTESRSGSQDSP